MHTHLCYGAVGRFDRNRIRCIATDYLLNEPNLPSHPFLSATTSVANTKPSLLQQPHQSLFVCLCFQRRTHFTPRSVEIFYFDIRLAEGWKDVELPQIRQ